MKKKNTIKYFDFESVPLKERWIAAISPGLFFADIQRFKFPFKSWEIPRRLAKKLHEKDGGLVAFKRFVYDPEEGEKVLDSGWWYFGGEFLKTEDLLKDPRFSGKEHEILRDNIKNNGIKDCMYFKETGKVYQFNEYDNYETV